MAAARPVTEALGGVKLFICLVFMPVNTGFAIY